MAGGGPWAWLVRSAVVAAVYAVLSLLNLQLTHSSRLAAGFVWPTAGIGLAVLLIGGMQYVPALFAGRLLMALAAPSSFVLPFAAATGSVLEQALAALLLQRIWKFDRALDRISDVIGLIAVSCAAPLACGGLVVALDYRFGVVAWADMSANLFQWWRGDSMGMLAGAPIVLIWSTAAHRRLDRAAAAQLAAATAVAAAIAYAMFVAYPVAPGGGSATSFLAFPFLVWAAMRFGQPGAVMTATPTLAIALWGALATATDARLAGRGLELWGFMAISMGTALLVAAALAERRAEAEARLAATDRLALMAHALGSANDCIVICDVHDQILYVNDAFRRLYEYSDAELIGQPISMVRADRNPAEVLTEVWPQTMAQGWRGELWNRARSGREFLVDVATSTVRTEQGDAIATVAVARDITGEKRAEEQLRQSQKMEALGRLAAGVAHDFNNLLTVITGYTDLLLDHAAPSDQRDLQMIRQAGERAAGLTRQLLAFSRRQAIQPRLLSLNGTVAEVQGLLERVVGEHIEVSTTLEAAPDGVLADPSQLHQVVMNLALNARDAMPSGGHLTIRTMNLRVEGSGDPDEPPGEYVMLSVGDTGTGMDEATRARIFEPFFTTKERSKGTGLGLSMVYGIARQSRGFVRVASQIGTGTDVQVFLPVHAGTEQDARDTGPSARTPAGAGTVLVVEDQDVVRQFAVDVLSKLGYRMLAADGGIDALRQARTHDGPIDVLLTDVVMPGVDGKTVAEQLREMRPGIAVVFMSGYPDDVLGERGVVDANVLYLSKPFSPRELASKMREALATRPLG